MRQHLNFVILIGGVLVACTGLGGLGPLAGALIVASELYRCHRIDRLTAGISAETIRQFYRGDRARRYFGARSTGREILKFAGKSRPTDAEVEAR